MCNSISLKQIIYASGVTFCMCLDKDIWIQCQIVQSSYPLGLTEGWERRQGWALLFKLSIYRLYAFSKQQQILFLEKDNLKYLLDYRGNQMIITTY